jgi:hypothetical protein
MVPPSTGASDLRTDVFVRPFLPFEQGGGTFSTTTSTPRIDDTPRDQWTIQGMRAPDSGSEQEKRWIRKIGHPSQPALRRRPKR